MPSDPATLVAIEQDLNELDLAIQAQNPGTSFYSAHLTFLRGSLALRRRDFDEAHTCFSEAAQRYFEVDAIEHAINSLDSDAETLRCLGKMEEYEAAIRRLYALTLEHPEIPPPRDYCIDLAITWRDTGHRDWVLALAPPSFESSRSFTNVAATLRVAHVLSVLGERERCIRLLDAVIPSIDDQSDSVLADALYLRAISRAQLGDDLAALRDTCLARWHATLARDIAIESHLHMLASELLRRVRRPNEALREATSAVILRAQLGETVAWALSLHSRSRCHVLLGNLPSAIDDLETAASLIGPTQAPQLFGLIQGELATHCQGSNWTLHTVKQLRLAHQLLTSGTHNDSSLSFAARLVVSLALRGQTREATSLLEATLAAVDFRTRPSTVAYLHYAAAELSAAQGDATRVQVELDHAARLAIQAQFNSPVDENQRAFLIANAFMIGNRLDEAIVMANSVDFVALERSPSFSACILSILGYSALAQQRYLDSVRYLREAARYEARRAQQTLSTSPPSLWELTEEELPGNSVSETLAEACLGASDSATDELGRSVLVAEALRALEGTRCQVILDTLSDRRRWTSVAEVVDSFASVATTKLENWDSSQSMPDLILAVGRAQRKVENALGMHRDLLLEPTGTRSAREVFGPTRSGEVIVFIGANAAKVWGFSFSGSTMLNYAVEESLQQVEARSEAILSKADNLANSVNEEALDEFSRLLFGPAEEQLLGATSVVIVPVGALSEFPFELLRLPRIGRFVDRFSIRTIPSLSINARLRMEQTPGSDLEMVAFGVSGTSGQRIREGVRGGGLGLVLPDLPRAPEEARLAAARFRRSDLRLGNTATKSEFKRLAGQGHILHIATHAMSSRRDPLLLSGFWLAPTDSASQPGQGDFVSALDIMTMDLSRVELAVLSACRTSTGRATRYSGVLGLSTAFLMAGCKNVIGTLWKVYEEATAFFLERIYSILSGGKSIAEALRLAKLDMIRSEKWSSPYYWAPFVLTGRG